MTSQFDDRIRAAVDVIRAADALLIGAGAGMGVDSGLPDFRGRRFAEMSTPHWFESDPPLAWGFFGHRLNLYRNAIPHDGFRILLRWLSEKPVGGFVFTSNVDGQFQKAGFPADSILECHGSIHFLQCTANCGHKIWSADAEQVEVDETTIRAISTLPTCPECGAIARPNILMFGDAYWDESRSERQLAKYTQWLRRAAGANIVAVEMGAGLAIPTVRRECESRSTTLVRINPLEAETPTEGIELPMGALAALQAIDAMIQARG